jgi:CMP-N-acetylneuraminic acid synthetase
MKEKDRVMILIPAKGKSRRLPDKNMRMLGKQTLVDWAVERSLKSMLGIVFVSSDSEEIKNHVSMTWDWSGEHAGIRVWTRPSRLAKSNIRVTEVCKHIILVSRKWNYKFDTLILTLPSSPLVTADDLKKAYRQFIKNDRMTLFGVKKMEKSDTLLMARDGKGVLSSWSMQNMKAAVAKSRDEQYGDAYVDVGAMVIMDIPRFLKVGDYYEMHPWQGYVIPEERAVDIDTELDLKLAEVLLNG